MSLLILLLFQFYVSFYMFTRQFKSSQECRKWQYFNWKPFVQIVIWFIIPATRRQADHNNNALALIVLIQYVPRLYLIFPLSSQIIKATGLVTKTAWAGAAYNLLLYMLASHVCKYLINDFLGQNHLHDFFVSSTSFFSCFS